MDGTRHAFLGVAALGASKCPIVRLSDRGALVAASARTLPPRATAKLQPIDPHALTPLIKAFYAYGAKHAQAIVSEAQT